MLYESLIVMMCASNPGNYSVACTKASQASATSMNFNKYETNATNYMLHDARNTFGETLVNTVGVIAFVGFQGEKSKKATYKFNTKGLDFFGINYIKPEIDYNTINPGGSVGLGWFF